MQEEVSKSTQDLAMAQSPCKPALCQALVVWEGKLGGWMMWTPIPTCARQHGWLCAMELQPAKWQLLCHCASLITLWLTALLTAEAQRRASAKLVCSLGALIKAAGLFVRGKETKQGRDVAASLCMCCHTCLHLGHSQATSISTWVQGHMQGSHLGVWTISKRHNYAFM